MNPEMIMGAMMHMCGLQIISTNNLPKFRMKQYRFPRSKSKRIRMKWSKRNENYKQVPIKQTAYAIGNTIIMSPETERAMKVGLFGYNNYGFVQNHAAY